MPWAYSIKKLAALVEAGKKSQQKITEIGRQSPRQREIMFFVDGQYHGLAGEKAEGLERSQTLTFIAEYSKKVKSAYENSGICFTSKSGYAGVRN